MGRLQRRFGLTIDNIRAVELVTADGRVVRTSADEHPDLFWGVRGAGANFGVATRFEFALHPLDGTVTQGSVVHPLQRAHELAAFFRELVAGAPRTLMASFAVMPAEATGGPAAMISVLHSGSPDEAERDLAELRRFGPPLADTIEPKPYLVTQGLNDEPLRWGRRFYMKSAFLPALPDEVVSAAVDHGTRAPAGCNGEITVWAWGGAIGDVADADTAFTGRDAAFWAAAEADWDDPTLDDASRDWGRAFVADILPFAQGGRYVNDVAEPGEDPAAIYGDTKRERLADLKRSWDPDNTFRLNQNVKP
jgi:FAD/FMN-containing dehydrogenase